MHYGRIQYQKETLFKNPKLDKNSEFEKIWAMWNKMFFDENLKSEVFKNPILVIMNSQMTLADVPETQQTLSKH